MHKESRYCLQKISVCRRILYVEFVLLLLLMWCCSSHYSFILLSLLILLYVLKCMVAWSVFNLYIITACIRCRAKLESKIKVRKSHWEKAGKWEEREKTDKQTNTHEMTYAVCEWNFWQIQRTHMLSEREPTEKLCWRWRTYGKFILLIWNFVNFIFNCLRTNDKWMPVLSLQNENPFI